MSDSTDPLRAIIVGAGFSGTLVAIHLLRQGTCVHIDLIDPRIPGRGLAYSTVWDDHLLNVPAIRMSAFGSEPMHFLDWLHANGRPDADAGSFAPRKLYGAYLQDVLENSVRTASARCTFRHHMGEAVHAWSDSVSAYVLLRNGERVQGGKIVLACGNPPPRPLAGGVDSPWVPGAFANLDRDRDILLIGAGLTAVDAFLALQAQGHRAKCISSLAVASFLIRISPIARYPNRFPHRAQWARAACCAKSGSTSARPPIKVSIGAP